MLSESMWWIEENRFVKKCKEEEKIRISHKCILFLFKRNLKCGVKAVFAF